jgi:hypothetical protein
MSTHRHDSSVDTAMEYRGSRLRFSVGDGNFFLHHSVQNSSDAHTAFYPMRKSGSFPGVKRAVREAHHSSSPSTKVKECVELYLHSSSTFSWRYAQLNHRDKFTSVTYSSHLLIYLILSNDVFIK